MPQVSQKLKDEWISAPLKGLNLIASPVGIDPEEALELSNYYIYDSGIRERAVATNIGPLADGGNIINMFAFTSVALNKQYVLLSSSATNIYLYDGTSISVWQAGINFSGACAFNKFVILPRGGVSVDTFNMASGARVAAAFTTAGNCIGSFVYRDRVYLWSNLNSVIEYGGVGAVAGAVATFDFGQVFKKGQNIIFGCSWSYNQGFSNQDLFVVGNEAGEVLVYSGGYPADVSAGTPWTLVTRLEIPAPLTTPGYPTLCSVIKNGQDILVNTLRGVISLASVMAGKNDQTGYYSLSRNLGPVLTGAQMDISKQVPFAYFGGTTGTLNNVPVIYVLNYERGAWSRFQSFTSASESILSMACQTPPPSSSTPYNISSYVLISTNAGKLFKISETATVADSNTIYTWQTPYFQFGTSNKKTVNRILPIARNINASPYTVQNTAFVGGDFNQIPSAAYIGDSQSTVNATAFAGYQIQELRPASFSYRWLTAELTKAGSSSNMNEVAGMCLYYEESGD